MSLRQVEERTGLSNAHLSQIERGVIRRPDPAIVMQLCDIYDLDHSRVVEWGGYVDTGLRAAPNGLVGRALRTFVELDPVSQAEAVRYLETLAKGRSD
jgi:transcriptional regulator with XRE-family HTH domain